MTLAKFLNKNNLSVKELKKILEDNGIDENLRFINKVPLEWQGIVNGNPPPFNTDINTTNNEDHKKVFKSFEELKDVKPSNNDSPKKTFKTKTPSKLKSQYFLAYAKFIAHDRSHGFVYKIKEPANFYGNVKKGDHQLSRGFKNIHNGDIFVCRKPFPQSFKVKFYRNYLEGIVSTFENQYFFFDFKLNNDEEILLTNDFSNFDLKDKFNIQPNLKHHQKLSFSLIGSIDLTKNDLSLINEKLKELITCPSLKKHQLSFIKWCLEFSPELIESNIEIINESYEFDLNNKNNIPIRDFVSKWSLLQPDLISFNQVFDKKNALEFLNIWADGKISNNLFSNKIIEIINIILQLQDQYLHLQLLIKKLPIEKKEVILNGIETVTIDNESLLLKTLSLLTWLNTRESIDKGEKIFFLAKIEIQIKLFLDNSVSYKPKLTKEEQLDCLKKSHTYLSKNNLSKTIDFIEKWKLIGEHTLSYNMLSPHISDFYLFETWRSQKLPIDFFKENIIQVLDTVFKSINNPNKSNLKESDTYNEELTEFPLITEQLSNEINIYIHNFCENLRLNELNEYNYYLEFLNAIDTTLSHSEINNLPLKASPQIQLHLWTTGKSEHVPVKIAQRKFNNLKSEKQSELINLLPYEELPGLLKNAKKDISKEAVQKLLDVFHNEINKALQPIVFDLELRNDKIVELAWTGIKTENCIKIEELDNYIDKFNRITNDANKLIIGHNIIDFDCPILEERGIKFHSNKIWDTLLIESLLSPELQTLSLNTSHKAFDDCKNNLQLFYNQIYRYIILPDNETQFFLDYLPENIGTAIQILKSKYPITWLDKSFLLNKRNTFFLPQPKQNNLAYKLNKELKKVEDNTLIIGPELIMPELFKVTKLDFHNSANISDYKKLNNEKIEKITNDKLWVKQVLKSYLNYAKTNFVKPVKGGLAPFVQHRINNEINLDKILNDENELSEYNYACTFISVNELSNNLNNWKSNLFENLIIIAPDLISTSNADLITTLNIKNLFNNNVANEIWMHFSGGQSFHKISKEQCQKLGVSMNSNYSDLWLEKFEFGNYRLYGHHNWEDQLNELKIKNKIIIEHSTQKFNNEQLVLPKIKNTSKASSTIVRLNPETIFRKQYWVFQKELINSISLNGKPIVLFIPREEEISALENYFSSIGYYIPSNKNSISRKIEKLFSTRHTQRLVIAKIKDLKFFAQKNHKESLNFVIDSFSLQSNFHNALGSNYLKDLINKSLEKQSNSVNEENEEPENEAHVELQKPSDRLDKDTFFHLKLQKPFIDYLRDILNQYDPNHTLWVLDPRVNDFPDLYKWWNATSKQLSVWKDASRYENEIKLASIHIHSPEPLKELPISTEKTKKALSNSFLNGNPWYDYQVEYLDKIIPSNQDLLISLPTGAGKSLLFQAPSLFKSSFTNKLSIVVTPLKALMEDQAKELWNKGFINNVEYINSDRKSDIPMIYRSIAGGELSLLYITPERFRSNGFINALKTRIKIDGSLEYAIFDEAHCVSQWGHDFRPDYLNSAKCICSFRKHTNESFPILLFSATVSEKIYNDFNQIFI